MNLENVPDDSAAYIHVSSGRQQDRRAGIDRLSAGGWISLVGFMSWGYDVVGSLVILSFVGGGEFCFVLIQAEKE